MQSKSRAYSSNSKHDATWQGVPLTFRVKENASISRNRKAQTPQKSESQRWIGTAKENESAFLHPVSSVCHELSLSPRERWETGKINRSVCESYATTFRILLGNRATTKKRHGALKDLPAHIHGRLAAVYHFTVCTLALKSRQNESHLNEPSIKHSAQ